MKKSLQFFLLFAVFAGCLMFAEEPLPATVESGTTFMRDALAPYVEDGRLPGAISILYMNGRQETTCIGYADMEAKRPITLDDAFMQCSLTKGFCGVTMAMLVEEGKVTLDDPVSKYLPEFDNLWVLDSEEDGIRKLHKAKNVLTIRMVMNHTGGFPFEICAKQPNLKGGGWTGGAPLRQVAAIAAACPLRFEPGTKAAYSNTGIDIGAAVIEVVTGKPWEQFLKERVLDPLGMTSTTFYPTDEMLAHKIELYRHPSVDAPAVHVEEMRWQQRPYNDSHVFVSAGAGLWTTARDQVKFYKMLMNLGIGDNGVRILQEETVKRILAQTSRMKELQLGGYSLGLETPVNGNNDGWLGHGGAWCNNAYINWRRKEMRIWVIQCAGGPHAWDEAKDQAAQKFFNYACDATSHTEYTGRTTE